MKFSDEFNKIVEYARDEAARTGRKSIETLHLLLGIIRHGDNGAMRAVKALGADPAKLKKDIEDSFGDNRPIPFQEIGSIGLSLQARGVIGLAMYEARTSHARETGAIHLLLGISNSEAGSFLEKLGISHSSIMEFAGKCASGKKRLRKLTFVIPIDKDKPVS